MTKYRKGDVVTIQGTIDNGFVHEGKIKIRVEPYSDLYVNLADLTMVKPVIEVGDSVTYPAQDFEESGEVLAIIDGYCWVKLAATKKLFAPHDDGSADGLHVSWPLACLNRVDPEPDTEAIEPAPSSEEAA